MNSLPPAELLRDLVARVKAQRLSRKWSQQELAERAGIHLPTYRAFEQHGKVSLARFVRILQALGREDDLAQMLTRQDLPSIDDVLRLDRSQAGRVRAPRRKHP